MDWMSWKTWGLIGLVLVAIYAIYLFAAPAGIDQVSTTTVIERTPARSPRLTATPTRGVGTLHTEWLDKVTGSYQSERNLFAYIEPPPPPPPAPPKPAPTTAPVPLPLTLRPT